MERGQKLNASQEIVAHPVRFHGQEGQYFRIWIVNVLLSILTLGLYTPWARRRTVQYFFQNTEMAEGSFEFAAPIRRMLVGFLLFGGLYLAVELAGHSDDRTARLVGNLAMAVIVLASPWLWASAMRFRFRHTRWRGLRLVFAPRLTALYVASWPLLALAVLAVCLVFSSSSALRYGRVAVIGLPLLILLLGFLCLALLQFNYSRLLVLETRIGNEAGRWKVERGPYLGIALQAIGIAVLLGCVIGAVSAIILAGYTLGMRNLRGSIMLGLAIGASGWLMCIVPAMAWREARTFQLVWNNTGISQLARFRCDLRIGSFVGLRVRNAILTLVTLGLYRPFARVKVYRMKCESVTVHLRGGTEALVGQLVRQQDEGGFSDALADGLGLDMVGA
ncbi:Uncharacterized membrane protein YjgN, DUF898 family [Variovorax sp. OV329]|nr:Uncharacterized membrane protein YjgN, DUF898 family [Variovorax sp. OV329]